jgi:hypothetical protein
MAIARFYKKVDLFLTMMTNPKWPEIERELLPGQTAYDGPELTVQRISLLYLYLVFIFALYTPFYPDVHYRSIPQQTTLHIYLHRFAVESVPIYSL